MVDARGYLCPMPVVMVQEAIKKDQPAALDVRDPVCRKEQAHPFLFQQGKRFPCPGDESGTFRKVFAVFFRKSGRIERPSDLFAVIEKTLCKQSRFVDLSEGIKIPVSLIDRSIDRVIFFFVRKRKFLARL